MAYNILFACFFKLLFLFASTIKAKSIDGKSSSNVVKCITLKADCMNDLNCYTDTISVNWFCQGLFYGKGEVCSEDCKYELGNFTSKNGIGKALATCSCENDALCLTYRARGLKCFNNAMKSNKTGCSSMLRRCRRDKVCVNLWENFLLKCTHLISGTECTEECKEVRKELYSHRLLKGYDDCECNGFVEEEKFCRGVRAHFNSLCKPADNTKNGLFENLPNSVELGTNLKRLDNANRNHGTQIRSFNAIFFLTVIIIISQAGF